MEKIKALYQKAKVFWQSSDDNKIILISVGVGALVLVTLLRVPLWGKKGLLKFIPSLKK